MIKILFFASNPVDTPALALDEEIRSIENKIRAAKYRDNLKLIPVMAPRPDDFLQKLNQFKPQIVHFSGHGSKTGELILIDDYRQAKPVSAAALKSLFTTLKDNIRVVMLNACYSRAQAEGISETIDCVVGMETVIGDQAAIVFAASFYRAIGFGRSVQEAFDQGKTALLLEGIPEESTPQLLIRQGVDPASIFLGVTNAGEIDKPDILTPGEFSEVISHVLGKVQAEEDSVVDDAETLQRNKEYGTAFIEKELPRIAKRQQMGGRSFSVVFVDIDDLTKINKHYGNEVGNMVIDIVLELIRRRSVARYKGRCGDDTFYAVLFDTSKVDDFCEKLRRDVQHYPWRRIAPNLHVTCTMGHATLKPGENPFEWLSRSIHGMLEGKKQGGNTVQSGPLFSDIKYEGIEFDVEISKPSFTWSLRGFFS